ncbi:MAG: MBL fold metallo-hydrolase [Desulfuromonadales bacterium]|nr:MBL fold metallo-hydrolase [Desulfuromonadales bacterium]
MTENLLVHQLSVGPLQVNCFVVACQRTREAMVIDPGEDGPRILQLAESNGYQVKKIVNTHGHFDHIGANQPVKEATGAVLMMHEADLPLLQNARNHAQAYGLTVSPSPDPDKFLNEGDIFSVGEQSFSIFHVPGHSPGSICLLSDGHLFVGDVLFAGSVGRTDLPGGDFDALIEGVREKLFRLPADTIVHPGHGPDTTIGREKQTNPFVGDGA